MKTIFMAIAMSIASAAHAELPDINRIVEQHILPSYAELNHTTQQLADRAQENCSPSDASLIEAYSEAFDAWVKVSHLRFGPSEIEDRAFALAFWPDPRGSTPKALNALIRNEDQSVASADRFQTN